MPEFIISKDIPVHHNFLGCIQGAGAVGTKTDKTTQALPFKGWQAGGGILYCRGLGLVFRVCGGYSEA